MRFVGWCIEREDTGDDHLSRVATPSLVACMPACMIACISIYPFTTPPRPLFLWMILILMLPMLLMLLTIPNNRR